MYGASPLNWVCKILGSKEKTILEQDEVERIMRKDLNCKNLRGSQMKSFSESKRWC